MELDTTPAPTKLDTREPPTERDLLKFARDFLIKRIPSGWTSQVKPQPGLLDATWMLDTPDGRTAHVRGTGSPPHGTLGTGAVPVTSDPLIVTKG